MNLTDEEHSKIYIDSEGDLKYTAEHHWPTWVSLTVVGLCSPDFIPDPKKVVEIAYFKSEDAAFYISKK